MEETTQSKTCPKCGGGMIVGGIYTKGSGGAWLQGAVVIRDLKWYPPSMNSKDSQKVITFACTQCGYLESYLENVK